MLCAIALLALGACATTSDTPEGSSPADRLRKAERAYDLEGELEVTLSRTT